jgi:hypothetical protein
MAIGRVSGSMLVSNLDRQGTDLQFTTNSQPLVYMNFSQFKFGVNTNVVSETVTINGNLSTSNVLISGLTISAKNSQTLSIGSPINLGDIGNVKVTGGLPNYIVYTDGAGNLNFGNLNALSGLEGFTGNNISLGANTVGSLSAALTFSTSSSVTDGIASLNQLLGNITDSVGSTIHVASGIITGNLTVLGNINGVSNSVASNTGAFYGNFTTGFGALYAGIPTGYSVVPNEIAQFSGNANSYVQINAQNINSGTQATTDWIATAPQGTDTTYYVDVGIAGLTYDNTSPNNSLGTSLYGGDSYVYAQGNTSATAGGNLVVGTTIPTKVIKFISGGVNSANVVATISSNAFIVNASTPSTSQSSGALVVTGGAGISGNVYANAYITTNGVFWSNGARALYGNVDVDAYLPMYTGNVASGNVITTGNVYTNYISATTGNVVTFTSTGAVKLPIGNSSNRPTGAIGEIRYNTDTSQVEFYNGLGWIGVTSTVTSQQIVGDNVNSTFTLDQNSTNVGVLVSINGTIQQPTVAYTVSGNQITFSEVPLSSDTIDIRYLGGLATLNNTLTDDLTVSGNITLSGILSAPQTTKASNAIGTVGQICWDANYIYVCTATNTWKRSPLTGGY